VLYNADGSLYVGALAENTGGLYPNFVSSTTSLPRGLSAEQRDDGYNDEFAFCNPGTCALQCNGGATYVEAWKGASSCVFLSAPNGTTGPADSQLDAGNAAFVLDRDWAQARAHCQAYGIGADLAVLSFGTATQASQLSLLDGWTTDSWIGLHDIGTAQQEPLGVWVWLDSTTPVTPGDLPWTNVGETNDPGGDPDDSGGDQDCGNLYNGELWDYWCSYQAQFFCEFDPTP
jgi:hypothetical protein